MISKASGLLMLCFFWGGEGGRALQSGGEWTTWGFSLIHTLQANIQQVEGKLYQILQYYVLLCLYLLLIRYHDIMYYVKCLGQQCISAIKIINYYYYYWILQLRQGFTPHQLHTQYLPMNIFSILTHYWDVVWTDFCVLAQKVP